MGTKPRWTVGGTSSQVFSLDGEKLFYVTMVDGWHDQITPLCARILALLNVDEKSITLRCDGPIGKSDRNDCDAPVTHIDEKGYVYCKDCGNDRKASHRCRKLTTAEMKQLRAGQPLRAY